MDLHPTRGNSDTPACFMVCSSRLLDPAIFAIFSYVSGKHQNLLSASVEGPLRPNREKSEKSLGRGWLLGRCVLNVCVKRVCSVVGLSSELSTNSERSCFYQ